jgi:UDP-glucose 4-epimerase
MAAVIGIFEELYKKGKPLTVVAPGTQKRDFTHISDIINGCFLAWKKGKQNEYMIGSNKTYTIIQIAKMFESKIKYLPARRGERFGSTKKNNNANEILGYSPKIKIFNYIKNFKKKYSKSF